MRKKGDFLGFGAPAIEQAVLAVVHPAGHRPAHWRGHFLDSRCGAAAPPPRARVSNRVGASDLL